MNFTVQTENLGRKKKGKREYLNNQLTRELMTALETFLETEVEIQRIKYGKRQTIETLINEETLLFAWKNEFRQKGLDAFILFKDAKSFPL